MGQVVADRFEVRERLREGGQATVYRVFDRLRKVDVALKLVHPAREPERAVARLRREVRIAQDAASPYLVQVFDIGGAAQGTYLTMEYLPGGSLREKLQQTGTLNVDEAVRSGSGQRSAPVLLQQPPS